METEKSTQNKQILEHLQSGRTITPLEALNLYGCFRLGARIFDLRKRGYLIDKTIIIKGRKHFAEYILK